MKLLLLLLALSCVCLVSSETECSPICPLIFHPTCVTFNDEPVLFISPCLSKYYACKSQKEMVLAEAETCRGHDVSEGQKLIEELEQNLFGSSKL